MKTLYTAHATATGEGRNGHVKTDDGLIDLELKMPKGLGGDGGATNPEQLFAAGYAACFHSALKLVAGKQKLDVEGSVVKSHVSIGQVDGGLNLAVVLDVTIPNLSDDGARDLANAAHLVCPYSKAIHGSVDVELNITA